MAKKDRNKGFNAPFGQLKARAAELVANKAAARGPTLGGRSPALPKAQAAPEPAPTDDAALFAAAMRDATPLELAVARVPAPVVRPVNNRPSDDEYALAELAAIVDGTANFRIHASEEEFYGAAPGVNNALLDGLRRGQYAFQFCLDLHGCTRDEAHQQVIKFVTQARCREGATCVLIVTGRGRSSPFGTSVLRETLPRWLSRSPVRPHVLAYSTARPVDGGPGAYYVLLRRQGVRPFGSPA